jgi:hypothetical protein
MEVVTVVGQSSSTMRLALRCDGNESIGAGWRTRAAKPGSARQAVEGPRSSVH